VSKGMQRRLLFCLLFAAIFLPSIFAEELHNSFPDHPRFSLQRLQDEFGLDAVTVTAMGQDSQGFLWLGTQTGLYRYDGARAQKMSDAENITGHYIVDLLIAPDGTPWFAGNHGIAHYRNGQFEALPIPASDMPMASGNQIFAVDSKGIAYVLLFKRGVLRIDPSNPSATNLIGEAEEIQESAGGIVRAADDSIWYTFGAHLSHIPAGSTSVEIDRQIRLPKERIVALLFDGTQTLWIRTAMALAQLDPQLHKITFEKEVVGSANEEEGKPTLDQRGRLLVPSSNGLYWQQDRHWSVVTDKQGISSNDIECATEDREGTLWVAGSGTGLDRLPGVHEWQAWTTSEGLPDNTTWATLRDRAGKLWISTSRGIAVWDGRAHRWERIPYLENSVRREVRQMQLAGDGSVWALSGTGALMRIDPTNFATKVFASYRGRSFVTIAAAPDGSVWSTTRTHIVRFSSRNSWSEPVESSFPAEGVGDVEYLAFSPNGALWASGPGRLHRFDGRNWQTYTVQDGLQGQTLTSLVPLSDSEIWLAYNDVVSITHVRLDAARNPHMDHYKWDYSIIGRDSKNRIWFDGTDGIRILSPDGQLVRKSHADGLIWDDVSPWTGVREEADGSFLIATSRGLARYNPAEFIPAATPPRVVLTSINLGGAERSPLDSPQVQASDSSLTVQFTPLILDNPDRVSCRYQLKGLDQQPAETALREVHYGGLPAGSYEFWAQCQASDTRAQSPRAIFHFRVLPKIWQTWWAELLGGLLVLVALWLLVSMRTRTEIRRRRELEHAVAQRSAELLQKNKELEEISITDPLTTTRNRRYFNETIPTDVAQALRSHLKTVNLDVTPGPKHELIFVLVDIDRFKRVNDEYGHAAGDRLLKEVAQRIASVMRRSDDLVRWGGEEFLLVCRTTDRENASMLCNRVLEAVRETPFDIGNGVQVHKTCSIGWAPFPWMRDDVGLLSIDNVIELADKGLYLAKREGRNRSFGMVPAPNLNECDTHISMDRLRDCPPELVQII
jgi:diguanylate cyclase (GGDEF)-like protein